MTRNIMKEGIAENNYYGGLRGGRPFATTNSGLVSATKILNQHLFGTGTGPRHYTGNDKDFFYRRLPKGKNVEKEKFKATLI